MKDAIETMGTILTEDVQGRDAVHVAVISAYATGKLYPGQHVGGWLNEEGDFAAYSDVAPLGIVDPFLEKPVWPEERFWLFLYPRTITGLRHVWTHPDFTEPSSPSPRPMVEASLNRKLASERWLQNFCQTADCPGYETVLAAARRVADGEVVGYNEEYLHFRGVDAHGEIPEEFWDHIEIILGQPIKGRRAKWFSCAC